MYCTMPVVQVIEGDFDLRKAMKSTLKSRYQVFLSSSFKEAFRSVQKNAIDIALIRLDQPLRTVKNWISKLEKHKSLVTGEISILLIADWKIAGQESVVELAGHPGVQDILWVPEGSDLTAPNFLSGLRIFLDKNFQTLKTRRHGQLLLHQKDYFESRLIGQNDAPKNETSKNEAGKKENKSNTNNFFTSGTSKHSQKLLEELALAPEGSTPVFLTGASGLEQMEIARYLHEKSWQQKYRDLFFHVNLESVPLHMQDTVLFGNKEKNLPGFTRAKSGLLEQMKKGSVLIESIEKLQWNLQTDLLRALRHGYYLRLNEKIKMGCKIIFSSYTDLEKYVEKGVFRQDLYSHLQKHAINIPTLSQRKSDIPVYIDAYLVRYNTVFNKELTASAEFKEEMSQRKFTGQVKELEETLRRLTQLANKSLDLPLLELFDKNSDSPASPKRAHSTTKNQGNKNHGNKMQGTNEESNSASETQREQMRQELGRFSHANAFFRENDHPGNLSLFANTPPIRPEYSLNELEREYIVLTLESRHYNIAETARVLGISRKTLYKKLISYGIQRTRGRAG